MMPQNDKIFSKMVVLNLIGIVMLVPLPLIKNVYGKNSK